MPVIHASVYDDRVARALIAFSAVVLMMGICLVMLGGRAWPGDAPNYLAAGERLNAGHDLYALVPGDRPVPGYPVPFPAALSSPPLVAVAWRPLALLGDTGLYLWWIGSLVALGILGAIVFRAEGLTGPLALYLLAVPLGVEAAQGNMNPFLEIGTIAVWALWARHRAPAAGLLAGLMAVAKVTPAVLALWIVAVSGRRGLAGAVVGVAGGLLLSVLGAGVSTLWEFVDVARSYPPSGWSLGGVASGLGLDPSIARLLPVVLAIAGACFVVLVRHRPALSFRIAVALLVMGSPAVYPNTFAFLAALLAPTIWPARLASTAPILRVGKRVRAAT